MQGFAERGTRSEFEGENRRIDVVEATVDQCRLDIDNREAGENTGAHDAVDALFDARNIFLWHRAADDLRFEHIASTRLVRLENDGHLRELARAASLLLMRIVFLDTLGQALAIGDLRRAD